MKLKCLLFIFVQSGLQEAEGVHQAWGEAALLSWRPSEPHTLSQGPIQVKLFLGLFTDQLSLSVMDIHTKNIAQIPSKILHWSHINTNLHTAPYLADEPGDEQKNQDTIVISTVTEERVRHEGGEERHLSVGLSHLHFPQLHLDGLGTRTRRSVKLFSWQIFLANMGFPTLA